MPRPSSKPPAMLPGEVQRHLIRLGFTIEQAAYALGISYEHMRALADGRSRMTERPAADLRDMTLADASQARLRWWAEEGFAKRRVAPFLDRSHTGNER